MDQQIVQRTRYLLQTRFRRLRNASWGNFDAVAGQVLDWLSNHPILAGHLQRLNNVEGDHHEEIRMLLDSGISGGRYFALMRKPDRRQDNEPEFKGYTPKTLEQHASACLLILRASIQKPEREFYNVLATYLTQEEYSLRTQKDPLDAIKDGAIRDLYEYIDEQLDGVNVVNGLLIKYKQSVEWFEQEHLQLIIANGFGGATGERALARHLQQYVFEQGVDFSVEPTSASGEVDLLLRDPNGSYTIIDAKYVKASASPSEIKRQIAEGFNQVARYCEDFNQHTGFLAVFVNDNVSILIDLDETDSFKYFRIGGNAIYYTEINIAVRPSASKTGTARQVHFTTDELVRTVEEMQSGQAGPEPGTE